MKIIESAFNNNPNIIGFNIPTHSPDWFRFRTTGIPELYEGGFGASEIATVCGKANPKYGKIIPVLLNEKAGITEPERTMNEHMLSGTLAEPAIKERWKYHDGTDKGYLQNFLDRKKVRECRDVDMYLVNQKYPWLFASLDAAILGNQGGLRYKGQMLKEEHPLECKQLSYFAAQTWESKIPPQYVYQVNQQMLVTETEYAELAVLQDGYAFTVYPFEIDVDICKEILEKSRDQWESVKRMRVLDAKCKYYLDLNQHKEAEKAQAELDSMIPEPDSGDGWKDFLNERMIVEKEEFAGTTAMFRLSVYRQKATSAEKKIKEYISLIENKLRAEFVRHGAEVMVFDGMGKVKYSKVGDRKDPQFNFAGLKRTKEAFDEEQVDEALKPILTKI